MRYRPATWGAQIGGDWYDAFAVPDGTTMVVIGDVAGHDAPSAAVMAQARGLLRGLAQSVVGSPAADAGHPPPALLAADGSASVLQRRPERLLGLGPDCPRTDHRLRLTPGDTLLLYTDGLVERRDESLDTGQAALLEQLRRSSGLPLEELCDDLLGSLGGRTGDDVVFFALRVR